MDWLVVESLAYLIKMNDENSHCIIVMDLAIFIHSSVFIIIIATGY